MSSRKPKLPPLPKPTAYTPFWRRWFCNERTREIEDTKRLFAEVTGRFAARWGDRSRFYQLHESLYQALDPPAALHEAFVNCLSDILVCEDALFAIEEPQWRHLDMKDLVELRSRLRAQERFLNHEEQWLERFGDTVDVLLNGLAAEVTAVPTGRQLFTMPLCLLFGDVNLVMDKLLNTFMDEKLDDLGIMSDISRELYLNVCRASEQMPDTEHKKPLQFPTKRNLPPLQSVDLYLADTPFHTLFTSPVPFSIPAESFFEHMHVVGGTGAGKTSWLAQLILYHIDDPARPAIVVVDSQGALIPPLRSLAKTLDRLIYIDPCDPPAINIFDTKGGAGDTFDYLFDGIVGADLTGKQSVFFDFLTRLMLSFPATMGRTATLQDMIAITADSSPYAEAIAQLPEVPRTFFERDFNSPTFKQTREQVRYRLNALLGDEKLERLFGDHTELDLGAALDDGALILIDTSKQYLGKNSDKFGRLFIFLILQEIFARTPFPQGNPHPVYLIVDEAHEYFDRNIDNLLTQVRKYRCGCVFAHQFLTQASGDLRASLASNTSIKAVAGVSMADARALAPDMRTTAEFILDQPRFHFALYVKHVTRQALSIEVTPGLLDQEEHVRLEPRPRSTPERQPPPAEETPPPPPEERPKKPRGPDEIDTSASEGW